MLRTGWTTPVLRLASIGIAALAAAVMLGALGDPDGDRSPASDAAEAPSAARSAPGVDPVAVLREWDRRRADAYARADAAALATLYTATSAAGRADLAVLGQYADRGLTVQGVQMQLIEVETVRTTPDRLVLDVTDRVRGAVAIGEGTRVPLPGDLPSTRRLTFEQADGGWRISRVLPRPGS